MILYHFTKLAGLLGEDGHSRLLKAWEASAYDAADGASFAAPGSILKSGLKPQPAAEYDGLFYPPMPACVWLTTNPDMSPACLNANYLDAGNWRVTVAVPSTNRRLVHWPRYFRKRAGRNLNVQLAPPAVRPEVGGFYAYFGEIGLDRIRAVEHVRDNSDELRAELRAAA